MCGGGTAGGTATEALALVAGTVGGCAGTDPGASAGAGAGLAAALAPAVGTEAVAAAGSAAPSLANNGGTRPSAVAKNFNNARMYMKPTNRPYGSTSVSVRPCVEESEKVGTSTHVMPPCARRATAHAQTHPGGGKRINHLLQRRRCGTNMQRLEEWDSLRATKRAFDTCVACGRVDVWACGRGGGCAKRKGNERSDQARRMRQRPPHQTHVTKLRRPNVGDGE